MSYKKRRRKLLCRGNSLCKLRRDIERLSKEMHGTSGFKIDPMPEESMSETPSLKGVDKISLGMGGWVGPCFYCPFCGRPTSFAATYYDIKVRK